MLGSCSISQLFPIILSFRTKRGWKMWKIGTGVVVLKANVHASNGLDSFLFTWLLAPLSVAFVVATIHASFNNAHHILALSVPFFCLLSNQRRLRVNDDALLAMIFYYFRAAKKKWFERNDTIRTTTTKKLFLRREHEKNEPCDDSTNANERMEQNRIKINKNVTVNKNWRFGLDGRRDICVWWFSRTTTKVSSRRITTT